MMNINELTVKVLNGELAVSKSPYSESWYVMKAGETIDWGEKPEGSLRIADHWNFGALNEHCKLAGESEKVNRFMVAEYRNGFYHEVKGEDPEAWAKAAREACLARFEKGEEACKARWANIVATYTADVTNSFYFEEEKKAIRKAATVKALTAKMNALLTERNREIIANCKFRKAGLLHLVAALEANTEKANAEIEVAAANGMLNFLTYNSYQFTATFNKAVIALRVLRKLEASSNAHEEIRHIDLDRFAEDHLGAIVETSVGYYLPKEALAAI